ncbi:hypothetical protein DUI87_15036 [Hirundo rustica rustica]|uniref:Uncharacterized protein n=1 Tax=Hirundo rustica rustica TaxID=333673 RepID=A0A3M0K6P2_HIRRU|nr:hypothetical protein DUI87_15036 [Hirundo rustica rustica]
MKSFVSGIWEFQRPLCLQNSLDYLECGLSKSYSTSSHALGIDLWRGRRCCSGNLQLPPLAQRQNERARTPDRDSRTPDRDSRTPDRDSRTPDRDVVCRPTTLPLLPPPSIAITTYQDWCVGDIWIFGSVAANFDVETKMGFMVNPKA